MSRNVVIVPGIMGSVLSRTLSTGERAEVWWDRSRLARGDYKYLRLANDGVSPGPGTNGVPLTPWSLLPSWGGWVSLVNRLQVEDWVVHWWPYDWRISIRTSAAQLAGFLLGSNVSGDYYLLTHSMGGLVARLAYPLVVAAGGQARWKRTLYVGVPQYGSYQAAQYLASPIQTEDLVGYILPGMWGNLTGAGAQPLRALLQREMRPIIASWPALYELLPNLSGPGPAPGPNDAALYDNLTYADQNGFVQQQWLDAARQTRTVIDATLTGGRPAERTVIATGQPTPDGLDRTDHIGESSAYSNVDGDGSVTAERTALAGVATKLTLDGGIHCDMPGDGRLIQRVTSLLVDGDPVAVTAEPFKNAIVVDTPPAPVPQTTPLVFIEMQRRNDP